MLREVVVEMTWWVWIGSISAELIRDKASLHIKLMNSIKAPKIFYSSISCIDILNIFYFIIFQGKLLLN